MLPPTAYAVDRDRPRFTPDRPLICPLTPSGASLTAVLLGAGRTCQRPGSVCSLWPERDRPLRLGRQRGATPLSRSPYPVITIIAWLIGNSIRQAHAQAELLRTQAAAQTALAERLRIAL